MGEIFQLHFFLFTLSLLLLTSISCNTNLGESRSYKFYYDGSYHVVATPPIESDDMTVDYCTNVDKPSRVLGDLKSSVDTGGECVIIYAQKDCQPPRLEAPSTSSISFDSSLLIDRIRSFHPCMTNSRIELPQPSEIQQAYLKTIDYKVNSDIQLEIKDECMDLPQNSDKKLSYVGTRRNCLLLYDGKNCQGASFKLANVGLDTNLDKVGWDKKVSSVKTCEISLQARIPAFKLTSKLADLKLDGNLRDGEIVDSQNFTNNETQAIVRTYEWKNVPYNDSFYFQSIESLSPFREIEVKDKMKLEGIDITKIEGDPSICFPVNSASRCIPVKIIEKEFKNAYHLKANNASHDKVNARNLTAMLSRNFSIQENVTVPPCSSLEVRSFMLIRENIRIHFDLGVTIFGENIHGANMTSEELLSNLPRGMVYLRNLDKHRIYGKTKGKIVASVGVKLKTDIRIFEETVPGCERIIIPITPTTTPPPFLNSTLTRDPKAIKDLTDISKYDAENGAQMDRANLFLLVAIGAVLLCTLIMCLITLCSRRSQRYPSEFELLTMGEYVLTVRCICPRCK